MSNRTSNRVIIAALCVLAVSTGFFIYIGSTSTTSKSAPVDPGKILESHSGGTPPASSGFSFNTLFGQNTKDTPPSLTHAPSSGGSTVNTPIPSPTNTIPDAPITSSAHPSGGSGNVQPTPVTSGALQWAANPSATSFNLLISIDPSFPAPATAEITLPPAQTVYDPAFKPATTYYWRVDAKTPSGVITGNIQHLTTDGSYVASCTVPPRAAVDFDRIKGIRTRFTIRAAGDDARISVIPDLGSQSLLTMMQALDSHGVNMGEVNIDALEVISGASASPVPDAEWNQYLADYFIPPKYRTSAEQAVVSEVEGKIATYQYTRAQRDQAVVTFFEKINDLRCTGLISDNISFLIHERYWLRRPYTDFSYDMTDIINALKAAHVDPWVAGIRLGENHSGAGGENPNTMPSFLSQLVSIASNVNQGTGNWLKEKAFLSNGGDMGEFYKGVSKATDFFQQMSGQTASFAFGYKWMSDVPETNILSSMQGTVCYPNAVIETNKNCNPTLAADWKKYLGAFEGLYELTNWINANATQYPMHANVIFVGDSSDSVALLSSRGDYTAPAFTALSDLFRAAKSASPTSSAGASGWDGKLFLEYSVKASMTGRYGADSGYGMYFDDGTTMSFNPSTFAAWQAFP
jgi:hypothetical protein